MGEVDLSRIDPLTLRENWLLGIGFLEGLVFVRVTSRSMIQLLYDPAQEGISNLDPVSPETFVSAQKFSSSDLNSTNILKVSDKDFDAYQLFFGIAPSGTRVFTRIEGGDKNELTEGNWGTNDDYRFGYINGFNSPLNRPAPESERLITRDIAYEWGVYNPYKYAIEPLFRFIINRIKFSVITDANLVQKILAGAAVARMIFMGGVDPVKYNMKSKWAVDPVKVDATTDEIKKALAV